MNDTKSKHVVKPLPKYFGRMFIFSNEWYQIETRDPNQPYLFPKGTPDLLQEYPRAMTQKANTPSTESFVALLKAYAIEYYSYECTDINCYSCERNVMWFLLF